MDYDRCAPSLLMPPPPGESSVAEGRDDEGSRESLLSFVSQPFFRLRVLVVVVRR